MEDSRIIQIAENKFPMGHGEEHIFLQKAFQNYINYCESLCPSFFFQSSTEIQRTILRNNFGLKDEDIISWTERASRYKMTPESFTFFLHIAMYSANNSFALAYDTLTEKHERYIDMCKDLRKENENMAALLELANQHSGITKKKDKKDKKKKKSKKRQHDSDDEMNSAEFNELLMNIVDDDDFSDRDRGFDSDRPIAGNSGKNQNDDQPDMEIIPDETADDPKIGNVAQQQVQQTEKISADSTKSSNKKNNKSNKREIQKVITGHKPTGDDTSRVRDILVYDVPVSWTAEHILQQLTLWGKPIDMQSKPQRKYQTLRLKIELSSFRLAQFEVNENPTWTTDLGGIPVRWFPARWTLKERKQREKFQATIKKIPESMTLAALWTDHRPHSFLSGVKGLKSFKIIKTARGERKLIGYFEKWVDMRSALDNQFVWEDINLSWNRYESPRQPTRSTGSNANKNQRISGSQKNPSRGQKTPKKDQDPRDSKKKSKKTKSDKPEKQKKDKSRDNSRSKILAEILTLLRKI